MLINVVEAGYKYPKLAPYEISEYSFKYIVYMWLTGLLQELLPQRLRALHLARLDSHLNLISFLLTGKSRQSI